jgi:hypothetical protein
MDNGEIYDFVTTILRKEKNGSVLTPEKFNLMLEESMWEKSNDEYRKYELSQIITDTLVSFKTTTSIAIDVNGEYDLSGLTDDYWHPSALTYDDSGSTRIIEIVTDLEYAERLANTLLAPDNYYPIAKFYRNSGGTDVIKVNPLVSVSATFDYLRKPTEPFYDYYINANDELVYMPPGTNHTLGAGEEYRDGTTSGTVNSISVELPFPEGDRLDVAYMILQKFGIPVREEGAVQYGAAREAKEDQI